MALAMIKSWDPRDWLPGTAGFRFLNRQFCVESD